MLVGIMGHARTRGGKSARDQLGRRARRTSGTRPTSLFQQPRTQGGQEVEISPGYEVAGTVGRV